MRLKRTVTAAAVALSLLATSVACSKSDDAKGDGQIDVWIAFTDYRLDWAKQRADEFHQKHPKYTVNIQGYDSYEVLFDAVTGAVQKGSPPSIVQYFEAATQDARDAVDKDGQPLFVSVEKAINGRADVLGEPVVLNDVVDAARNYYTVNGEFTSMPWNTSTTLFYANKNLATKAKVDKVPQTWAEIKEACGKIMKLADHPKHCVSWPNHGWFPEQAVAEQGGLIADNDNGRSARAKKLNLTSPELLNFVKFQKGLYDSGDYYYSGKQNDWDGPKNAFAAQEVAFLMTSAGDATAIVKDGQTGGFGVDVARMPYNGDVPYAGNLIGGATLWLTAGQEKGKEDASLAFMQFLNNPTNAASWHKTTGYVPITKAAGAQLETEGWYKDHPYAKVATEQLALTNGSPAATGVLLGSFVSIRAVVTQAIEDVLVSGADPDKRFAEAQLAAQKLLDDYNSLYGG
ncbi:ABC transporter substrate-binding protein [Actinorhabdospora filicis]|uniref:ABC transporter substrate-binding protein n=1 Tax=Actinorhabdospora filicis TaxID=1785913 RepID=A0A9W6SRU9_9ACTN|nr:extracellular solute-binding protein [Actinorhabdospora filicis]GLZ80687.1 ABC transporter substrate-binding protein [Actinorhabdospora filicis]